MRYDEIDTAEVRSAETLFSVVSGLVRDTRIADDLVGELTTGMYEDGWSDDLNPAILDDIALRLGYIALRAEQAAREVANLARGGRP